MTLWNRQEDPSATFTATLQNVSVGTKETPVRGSGVFVASGATVDKVENTAAVTTHGQNDMVLDNWGYVKEWVSTAPVTSTGPSGIGFVNFGDIDSVTIGGSLRTRGDDVVTLEVDKGATIRAMTVGGTIEALGSGSRKTSIEGNAPAMWHAAQDR